MATKALFNMAVNWFIRQRIDQIQNFMKHPIETQNGVLFSQLFHAEETEYGRKFDFKDISSYRDFQQQVPIVNYEEFWALHRKARQGQKTFYQELFRQFAEIFWNDQCQKQIHSYFRRKFRRIAITKQERI